MPRYDYKCEACEISTIIEHSMFDNEPQTCAHCDLPLVKIFTSTPVHFKGKGFNTVDKKGPFIRE